MRRKLAGYLKKKLFSYLPVDIRHDVIRKSINIPLIEDSLVYKLAETESEFEQAYSLLHDSYVEQGFIIPQKSGMRILPHFILPSSVTLIAINSENVVVGTLSIIKKSSLSLPMEKEFSIDTIKKTHENYAEISALAVKKGHRRVNGGSVFFYMLNFMYHYCVSQLNVRYISIVIHPKDEDFYSGLLFFKRIPNQEVIHYMGAPALAMFLDLKEAYDNFDKVYSSLAINKNLLNFFMTKFKNLRYIERPYYLNCFSTVTPAIFKKLFVSKGHLFDLISFSEYKKLKKALISTDLYSLLEDDSLDEISRRTEFRVSVSMRAKAIIDEKMHTLDISDVSGKGLQINFSKNLELNLPESSFPLQINLGDRITSKVTGKLVWKNTPYCGIQIIEYDQNWKSFVNYLYKGSHNYLMRVA